jgi:ankyrin repeat protein
MLDLLLSAGADPNLLGGTAFPQTPLMLAVAGGAVDKVRRLIAGGADVNLESPNGLPAIHHVASCPPSVRAEIVRLLVEAGASAGRPSTFHLPPTIRAVNPAAADQTFLPLDSFYETGDFETVRTLIDAGATEETLQWTPLMRAIVLGSIEDVYAELQEKPDLALCDRCGRTPMLLAVETGAIAKAAAVFAAGGDLRQTVKKSNALEIAIGNNHAPMIAWLVRQGFRVNEKGPHGMPLEVAAMMGAAESVRILLELGADPHRRNESGGRALQLAANAEVVKVLAEAAGGIDEVDGTGYSLLHLAAERDQVDIVRELLRQGADPNGASREGAETPLFKAVRSDCRQTVRMLLDAGADPNRSEADRWTPLFSAKSPAVARMLLEAGADPDAKEIFGETADMKATDVEVSAVIAEWRKRPTTRSP